MDEAVLRERTYAVGGLRGTFDVCRWRRGVRVTDLHDAGITEALVPEPRLRSWVGDRLAGSGAFAIRRVTTGHSNEIFRLERGGHVWLLRRPPRVVNAPTAHDMVREFRVMTALQGSAVPHAQPILVCDDPDVIGAPFYVMSFVEGVRLYDALPAAFDSMEERRRVGEELFDALAELHNVDWRAAGLDGFGRPDTFTERQVSRWMKQLSTYETRPLPELYEAAAWLANNVPAMQRPSLIHGDYGLHNVLYAPDPPARLVAVVDWETATIGDPLADFGYLIDLWLEGDEPRRWFAAALPYDVTGFPSRAEMIERYATRTGLDLTDLRWYRAVAQLKSACILEGGYARYLNGGSDNEALARFADFVPNHAEYALAIVRGEA